MDVGASIRAEQVRTLYGQSRPVLFANAAVAAILCAALWGNARAGLLLGWVGLVVVMVLVRMELHRRYEGANPQVHEQEPWARRFVLGSIGAGLLWGFGSVVFFDTTSTTAQLILTFAVGGMTAAAAGTLSCYLPAFFGFAACALCPLIARTFAVGDSAHLAMGGMMTAYAVGMQRVARINNQSLLRAFRLNVENTQLLERVSQSQRELEENNRTLENRVVERTSELERQESALRDARRLEVVGRLAGGIAHDFNNLLTIVFSNVNVLQSTQALDAEGRAALSETLLAAQRGADLIRQLLAFSRRQRTEPRVLDCNRVIMDLERLLSSLVGERVRTTFALSSEPLWVLTDRSQLEQVLLNLASNARDAMLLSGGDLRISTEPADSLPEPRPALRKFALIRVEDTGSGMDAETLRQVFDPFFSTKGPGLGSGLGLATVHGIIQQNGGRVFVSSEPNQGSRFSVYLPITEQKERVSQWPAPLPSVAQPRSATILVAEDEPTLRSGIRRSLERAGHTVLVADDGEHALALAKAYPEVIDLLVTDVVMPNLGGAETARLLTTERPGIGLLFISGYSWGESLPTSDPAKGITYLQKPFTTEALLASIAEVLAVQDAHRAETKGEVRMIADGNGRGERA